MIRRGCLVLYCISAILQGSALAQTLIDTVQVGTAPTEIVVDSLRNKIYVALFDSRVGVVDGGTDGVTTVQLPGINAAAMALNPITNKVYATSSSGDGLAVIDGATLSVTTLIVGPNVSSVAVNPVTNKVYLPSPFGTLTIVDGTTLTRPALFVSRARMSD
jgi:DNA-binding beta-propeller fold protein YncE